MPALPFNSLWPLLRNLCRPARAMLPEHAASMALAEWPQAWQQQHQDFTGVKSGLSFGYLPLQSAQLASMLQPAFGPSIVGLVHVSQHLQRFCDITQLSTTPLRIDTSWQAAPRASGRGCFLDCQQRMYNQSTGAVVLEGHSRYLSKLNWHTPNLNTAATLTKPDSTEAFVVHETHSLDLQQGRQYARLSGDWNPIHLGHWPARLFGLPTAIIHGAYLVSLLERTSAQPLAQLDVQFLKPVRYQQPFQLGVSSSGLWQIRQGDVLCLSATLQPASSALAQAD